MPETAFATVPPSAGDTGRTDLTTTDSGPRPLTTEMIASAGQVNAVADRNATAAEAHGASGDSARQPLFPGSELQGFRSQWNDAQGMFVDDPRSAVKKADELVANTVQRISQQFADERARLEQQWDRGEDVSTEDLRQALRRYRDFFDRLLNL